jgi:fluoride exporter
VAGGVLCPLLPVTAWLTISRRFSYGGRAMAVNHDAQPQRRSPQGTAFRRRVTLLAVIGAGGAIGAAARYGTGLAIPAGSGAFPVATFLVNVVGSVILGAVAALPAGWLRAHELARPLIGTGFCGGLTTFSTMSLQIYQLWAGHLAVATAYAVISLVAAPACAWTGFSLTQAVRGASRKQSEPPGPARGKEQQ